MSRDKAIYPLTPPRLEVLRQGLQRNRFCDEPHDFDELLCRIDEAEAVEMTRRAQK